MGFNFPVLGQIFLRLILHTRIISIEYLLHISVKSTFASKALAFNISGQTVFVKIAQKKIFIS